MKTVLLTGLFLLIAGLYASLNLRLILIAVFLLGLLLEAYIDLRYMIIPDEILMVLASAGVLYVWISDARWQDAMLGSLTGTILLGCVYFLSRGGLGLGDVKLVAALGLWLGVSGMLVHLVLAFLFSGLFALVLCMGGKATMQSKIPFGPFLGLGAVLSFFYSTRVLDWYCSRFL